MTDREAMRGVFLDTYPLDQGDVDLGPLAAPLSGLDRYERTAPEQLAERIADVEVVLLNKVQLDRAALTLAKRLKLVVLSATGTDNVDLDAAGELGVTVCNCRGYATASVVQHAIGLMLALTTRLIDYDRAVRAHRWQRSREFGVLDYPIHEVAGRTLGIVGYGELGRAVAQVAEALRMDVQVAERRGRDDVRPDRAPFEEVLETSDVLTLHCPLTPETRHLIDREALARMPAHALLINTARGGLIDERALSDALRRGAIGGAGVDVLSAEPPTEGNPLLEPDLPNVIVTPHAAWGSVEARRRAIAQMAESIRTFIEVTPARAVTDPPRPR